MYRSLTVNEKKDLDLLTHIHFQSTACDHLYHPFFPHDTGSWGDLKKLTILTSLKFKTKFFIKKKNQSGQVWGFCKEILIFRNLFAFICQAALRMSGFGQKPMLVCKHFGESLYFLGNLNGRILPWTGRSCYYHRHKKVFLPKFSSSPYHHH